ncbi:uncharacterized protein LOC106178975 [Lingula anatina]|uniref:Uncharacterized protein LOC106178975 n=1 Tax=Lingula anatina TaxID=7574 RepID=A0A1S3K6I3_LINAN|nr:uncharacterized protein LOC106178975 [Lingula anatina]XP_013417866.1 uncharacterized protein LOC106178975 [Lingula anatina]XP_013417867.1 uncharacterized protein LOC106178975 [Lingula anatina]|eukprot:XP_013417865.1 uncharacterized protein LOC106178975 [Lingula anatina]
MRLPQDRIVCDMHAFTTALVFGVHHAIADGFSAFFLTERILHILNARPQRVDGDDVVSIQPYFHLLLPRNTAFRLGGYVKLTKTFGRFVFPNRSQYVKRFRPQYAMKDGCTKTVALKHSTVDTERLMAKCKVRGVSVTGALLASGAIALANLVKKESKSRPIKMVMTYPIDMRRFMPPDLRPSFGYCISLTDVKLKAPAAATYGTFWELAKEATDGIHDKLTSGEVLLGCKIMHRLFSYEKTMKRFIVFPGRQYDFGAAYHGDFDKWYDPLKNFDHLRVIRLVGSNPLHDSSRLFFHNLWRVNSRLCYNLDYAGTVVADGHAHKYAKLTFDLMKMAAGEETAWSL